MRLRRHHEETTTTLPTPDSAWELPAVPAGAPVIHAPRAGDLVAPVAPVAAVPHAA